MKKSKKGFTLVELLVVIAIIAIIAAVAVPVTIGQINKSKQKTAANEVQSCYDAIEQAIADGGGAIVDQAALITYLNDNFAKPQYVTEITIDGASVTIETSQAINTAGDTSKIFTLSTDYAALIGAANIDASPTKVWEAV